MLELKNISKKFKDRQILSDFNLTVEENKILAIVGPSGGGKTTLLRMLAGLEKIDSGEIIYNGESLPIDELEKRNLLGFVFQDFQLFPHLTVLENLVLSPIKTMNMGMEDVFRGYDNHLTEIIEKFQGVLKTFKEKIKNIDISKERLVEVSIYAPQWKRLIDDFLMS